MENIDSIEELTTNSNKKIDDITLQLLTSRNNYKKCLQKTNPQEFRLQEWNIKNISKYKDKILKLTSNRLEDNNIMISNDMDEAFNHYIDTCIKYFSMKELESKNEYNDDDETIFSNWKNNSSEDYMNSSEYCENQEQEYENENDEQEQYTPSNVTTGLIYSYWGKKIVKKK